jgi:hypothetical protein
MRGHGRLAGLALLVLLGAVPARGQEPVAGTPGVPERSAVVEMRALSEAAPDRPQRPAPRPLPRPASLAGPLARTLRAPATSAAAPAGPLGPSPGITEDFLALPDNNTVIPPDTNGAVGPSHLVVALNSQVRVQNRDGSLAIADRSLDGFWSSVNPGGGAFDPKSLYDPYANRFIMAACDDDHSASSGILIGVSQTGDPTGSWSLFKIDADASNTLWADFTSIGFNGKWIVVQVNMFTFADGYVRSHIYVFDRAALYSGTASFRLIQDATGFTQAPARTYDMAQPELFLVEDWNGTAGQLRVSKISGVLGSEVLSVVGFPAGSAWDSVPPIADQAPQNNPPSFRGIATNDSRILGVVYRNGSLWTTHTVFAPTPGPRGRALVQWWQLSPAAAVQQNGRIDDSTGTNFYAFPSLAVNKLGDAFLGFSCFAQTRFASACYALRRSTDAPNTFEDVASLKDGLAKYVKTFGGPENRWGDYSATQVDPVNDVDFWTLQEYAEQPAGNDRWGTWWGHLALPPQISIDDVSLLEGNSGTTNAHFTVSLSFASTQQVEVDWAAADGSATLADGDYVASSGHLIFPPGTTSQFADVPVVGDLKLEPSETFVVNLSSPVFGTIADAQGQGTILNDDPVPQISIDDVRIVEGNAGSSTAKLTVTLSNPSAATVSASWTTSDGSATAGSGDYNAASGSVVFPPGSVSQQVGVAVNGDTTIEPDETFHVDLKSPVGATILKARGVGTILDDDSSSRPPVRSFTVVSDGNTGPTSGHDRLQWVNPVGGSPTEIRIRFTKRLGCTPPNNPDTTFDGLLQVFPPSIGAPGTVQSFDNTNLDLDTTYCYTIWAIYGGLASSGTSANGRPFDATSFLRWKYSTGTGTTGVAPPTVGLQAVLSVDNAGEVQAMTRSAAGGPWPAGPPGWNPLVLSNPSQSRNPIVPVGGGSRFFVTTQDGRVHAVDSTTGALDWSALLAPPATTGAPAGVFSAFGGQHDALFAGTSATDNNALHALDPATGALVASFGPPLVTGIGPILGMPVVDYSQSPENRVYFATRRGTRPETLWCLNLGPAGPLAFTVRWRIDVGDISGSPVLRNGRLYVGTDAGEVLSLRADDGLDARALALGDGPVRGFVFPDRTNDEVFASTNTTVWRLTDSAPWGIKWGVAISNPSPPLLWPGTTHVYVGGGDGRLYQIEVPTGTVSSLALDYDPGLFVVGAPSLDVGFGIVHVGSEHGTFYAVRVPLP